MSEDSARKSVNMAASVLAIVLIVMLCITIYMLFMVLIPDKNMNVLLIVVGSLITNVTAIVAFYFGSSSADKSKNETIASQAGTIASAQAALTPNTADKVVPVNPGDTVSVHANEVKQ